MNMNTAPTPCFEAEESPLAWMDSITAVALRERIGERRHTQRLLRDNEERFRIVADFAPVFIWMSDANKLCNFVNKPWLDFTGRPLDQELGNGWAEGVHPEDLQRCLKTYVQAFETREPFVMQYRL